MNNIQYDEQNSDEKLSFNDLRSTNLSELNNNEHFDKTIYKSAVRSLIYQAKCTRPDIIFAVGKVTRNSENPNNN